MKLSSGLMPPLGRPEAGSGRDRAHFVAALYERLDQAAAAAPDPGRTVTHRLNRTEYANAINDLLDLDVDARALLPADDTDQHGFDNNGDVLSISPTLLERYLSAARRISRMAVGSARTPTAIESYTVSNLMMQDDGAATSCHSARAAGWPSPTSSRSTANTRSRCGCRRRSTTPFVVWPTRTSSTSGSTGSASNGSRSADRREAAAGELCRHADLERRVGTLRESRRRWPRAALRRQSRHACRRHLVREPAVGA